jgi:hypothetical protein
MEASSKPRFTKEDTPIIPWKKNTKVTFRSTIPTFAKIYTDIHAGVPRECIQFGALYCVTAYHSGDTRLQRLKQLDLDRKVPYFVASTSTTKNKACRVYDIPNGIQSPAGRRSRRRCAFFNTLFAAVIYCE